MKIGILTQALHSNYGGLLQNYALQEVLRTMGHNVITIDRHFPRSTTFVKEFVKRILQITKSSYDTSMLTYSQKSYLSRNQSIFINTYIKHTAPLYSQQEFDNYVSSNPMDAYIVGSDQCWRPCYSANIYNYFLDFVRDDAIKISYAASYGVDKWEYSKEGTAIIRELSKSFDAISVREKSAVKLCKDFLGINASWVLDPTMLLGKEGFMSLVTPLSGAEYVLNYILEESEEVRILVQHVADQVSIKEIRSNIASSIFHRGESWKSHLNISVEQWISNIYNASFVITDSFHGAVFSIMFNVPFMVRLNAVRGNTRLESLLTDFDLLDCICSDIHNITLPKFDWNKINNHLLKRQNESMSFLLNALKK